MRENKKCNCKRNLNETSQFKREYEKTNGSSEFVRWVMY